MLSLAVIFLKLLLKAIPLKKPSNMLLMRWMWRFVGGLTMVMMSRLRPRNRLKSTWYLPPITAALKAAAFMRFQQSGKTKVAIADERGGPGNLHKGLSRLAA